MKSSVLIPARAVVYCVVHIARQMEVPENLGVASPHEAIVSMRPLPRCH